MKHIVVVIVFLLSFAAVAFCDQLSDETDKTELGKIA